MFHWAADALAYMQLSTSLVAITLTDLVAETVTSFSKCCARTKPNPTFPTSQPTPFGVRKRVQ